MKREEIEALVFQALSKIQEPDLNAGIVELKLVDVEENTEGFWPVRVGVHNPAMHSRKKMEEVCQRALETILEHTFRLEVIPLPPENKRPSHLRSVLPNVKHIVAIASGKGGVGKSTVTANLAVTLASKGYRVGIVDADIYGPSMPIMFGVEDQRPQPTQTEKGQMIRPVERHGIKMLSIGFFADMTQPVVWRGPMAVKALKQLFTDAVWGDLDFLLVDLPPGTGDIHLSLVQDFPLSGAIVVSTPQPVALSDASRAIAMFRLPSVNIPVLGMVENMSYFTPEELPQNRYYIFGKGGAQKMAQEVKAPLLGEVPLVQSIREGGDEGTPVALDAAGPVKEAFGRICDNMLRILKERMPAVEV